LDKKMIIALPKTHIFLSGVYLRNLYIETFEKCFPLKRDSSSRKAKILTTGIH